MKAGDIVALLIFVGLPLLLIGWAIAWKHRDQARLAAMDPSEREAFVAARRKRREDSLERSRVAAEACAARRSIAGARRRGLWRRPHQRHGCA